MIPCQDVGPILYTPKNKDEITIDARNILYTEFTTHCKGTRSIKRSKINEMFLYKERLQHSNVKFLATLNEKALTSITVLLF
jgi:hypothetical protein